MEKLYTEFDLQKAYKAGRNSKIGFTKWITSAKSKLEKEPIKRTRKVTSDNKVKVTNEVKPSLYSVYDKAIFIPFPTDKLLLGIKRYNEFRPNKISPDCIENHSETMLANYGKWWWINYRNERHGTGAFDSMEKAIQWFVKAGR